MNGKFEDKLAMLAFGELSPQEAAKVEAEARRDPETARALDTYRRMRLELRELKQIPDDQLSKERLRDAILAHGLKPKPVRTAPAWGWVWMPASAFVLAAALMTLVNRPASGPVVAVDDADVPQVVAELKPPTREQEPIAEPKREPRTVAIEQPEPTLVARRERPRRKRPAQRVEQSGPALMAMSDVEYSLIEDAPKEARVAAMNRASTPTTSTDVHSPGEDTAMAAAPIVIIEENRDVATGAFRATEVGASNVLIGG